MSELVETRYEILYLFREMLDSLKNKGQNNLKVQIITALGIIVGDISDIRGVPASQTTGVDISFCATEYALDCICIKNANLLSIDKTRKISDVVIFVDQIIGFAFEQSDS